MNTSISNVVMNDNNNDRPNDDGDGANLLLREPPMQDALSDDDSFAMSVSEEASLSYVANACEDNHTSSVTSEMCVTSTMGIFSANFKQTPLALPKRYFSTKPVLDLDVEARIAKLRADLACFDRNHPNLNLRLLFVEEPPTSMNEAVDQDSDMSFAETSASPQSFATQQASSCC